MNENNIEGVKGAGNINSIPPQNTEADQDKAATMTDVGTLDIVINDMKGIPISDLEFQIKIKDQIVASDKTDTKGKGKTIEGLKIGSTFDIYVKTDKGEFKRVAIGTMESEHCVACLTSPKTRFEFSTDVKKSEPGKAEEFKKNVIENSGKSPTETTDEHKVTIDKNKNGQPAVLVESAKIKPASADKIIAALPQVNGKKYAAGVVPSSPTPDQTIAAIPNQLVCNEYVFFAYGRAGEKLPYGRIAQQEYFKQQKRFVTDSAKGEVGDVGFFDSHEAIIIERYEQGKDIWYRYSGARNKKALSGALTDKHGGYAYLNQYHLGGSLVDGKVIPWGGSTPPDGFSGFKGFGKAGR
jgi:hypothetical protein